MRRILFPLSLCVVAACQPAPVELTDEQREAMADTILELEDAVVRAVDSVDVEAFMAHYANSPDLVIVSGGQMHDWAARREQLQEAWPQIRSNSHQIERRRVFVLGPNAAASTFVGELRTSYDDGRSEEVMLEVTSIWTRWNGEWKVLYEHVSSRPKSME